MATVVSLSGNRDVIKNRYDEFHGLIRLDDGTIKTFSMQRSNNDDELFESIVRGIENGAEDKSDLAELILSYTAKTQVFNDNVAGKLEPLGLDGRLTWNDNRIFMDGEPIDEVLEREIVKILSENHVRPDDDANADNKLRELEDSSKNWNALLLFIRDLYSNNNEYVRNQLFSWLKSNFDDSESNGFTLLEDGRVVGYKGVQLVNDVPYSIMSGLGLVKEPGASEFVEVNGFVPNKIGSIVTMPKSKVTNDPSIGCAPGLHIGTWSYASYWGGGCVLTVAFNANDVVSVPIDTAYQKLRVCRYEVLNFKETPYKSTAIGWVDDDDEDEYDDYDDSDYDDEDEESELY